MTRVGSGLLLIAATAGASAIGQSARVTPTSEQGVGEAVLQGCAVTRQGDDAVVSGIAQGSGTIEVSVDATGGVPTVTAHAINTKGTGATNHGRTASTACVLAPSPRATVSGAMGMAPATASCSVSGGADGPRLAFAVPVSLLSTAGAKSYVGHVTLNRRGMAGSGTVVAMCSGADARQVQYDLAVLKKA